jgi:hypothetical protein
MDREPISPERIHAWQIAIGARWEPWEVKLLRRLSTEYLAECRRAEDPHCLAPYMPPRRTAEDLAAEERQLRSVLG